MTRPRRSRCLSAQSLKDVEKTFLSQADIGNIGSIREEDTYQRESVLGAADAEIKANYGIQRTHKIRRTCFKGSALGAADAETSLTIPMISQDTQGICRSMLFSKS